MVRASCFAALVVSACTTTSSRSTAEESAPGPAPVEVAAADDAKAPTLPPADLGGPAPGPLEVAWGEQLRSPSSFQPCAGGMSDPPHDIGWAAATSELAFCVDDGGGECTSCAFVRPGQEHEWVGHGPDCENQVPRRELDERLRKGEFSIRDGDWIYGRDVILVLRELPGQPDGGGERGAVRLGARLRAEGSHIGWLARVIECTGGYCAPDVHVAAVAPSADGEHVAVLMHTFAGEFSDTYPLQILDGKQLAVHAYNAEGVARMRAGELERAVDLLSRGAAIDPLSYKPHYNLACAHAIAGSTDEARASLARAIELGGSSVRRKAANDADLTAVRELDWFQTLVGG